MTVWATGIRVGGMGRNRDLVCQHAATWRRLGDSVEREVCVAALLAPLDGTRERVQPCQTLCILHTVQPGQRGARLAQHSRLIAQPPRAQSVVAVPLSSCTCTRLLVCCRSVQMSHKARDRTFTCAPSRCAQTLDTMIVLHTQHTLRNTGRPDTGRVRIGSHPTPRTCCVARAAHMLQMCVWKGCTTFAESTCCTHSTVDKPI